MTIPEIRDHPSKADQRIVGILKIGNPDARILSLKNGLKLQTIGNSHFCVKNGKFWNSFFFVPKLMHSLPKSDIKKTVIFRGVCLIFEAAHSLRITLLLAVIRQ